MTDILHRVGIKAPAAQVYAALATTEGVAAWWTEATTGRAEPGGRIDVAFIAPSGEQLGAMGFDITALHPDRQVHWHCRSGPDEWIGTDVTFDLTTEGDYTIVLFGHRHWREAVEFTAHCSTKWATFLMSLKSFVETGEGRPAPRDVKIDNWN